MGDRARGLRARRVKLGALLPTFRDGSTDALAFADRCVDAGVDGLFAIDHLWPMGSPTRPSLAPFAVLAAVVRDDTTWSSLRSSRASDWSGRRTSSSRYRTLERLAPTRVICAVGSGTPAKIEIRSEGNAPGFSIFIRPINEGVEGTENQIVNS